MPEYRMTKGSMHERFMNSRAKIQVIGGGFGNGKTAAACVKAINILKQYPGANALIARSTFPKLNDTIRKEFVKWCPPFLIESFAQSKNSDNIARLTNGSMCNFRYIAQQGKNAESTTSNLLSATYDLAVIDQIEDPEIVEKDFYDILGRMRGNAVYRGSDTTMPKTGPRWLILTTNPTANWVYRRIVLPYHRYMASGEITEDLLCERDENGEAILIDGKPIMLMELFEGSTYENKRNLGADFIKTLESTYKGQMKDRFLMGKWASYEGLIYPEFDELVHFVSEQEMYNLYEDNARFKNGTRCIEGFDFGIASPSCFLHGYVDTDGNIHVLEGYHEKELSVKDQIAKIKAIRAKTGMRANIKADPSIFRRSNTGVNQVGKTTSEIFYDNGSGVVMERASNDITSGILKVKAYLSQVDYLRNPYSTQTPSPRIFFNSNLTFIREEFTSYMWGKKTDGTPTDLPVDKNDHAMDTIKYLLTDMPGPSELGPPVSRIPSWLTWQEKPEQDNSKDHRYG